MPTSIIITHPPPPPLFLKHPRCLSKVLSTQHSTGCLLNATRKPCYRENFISIKQLHGTSSRAQGTPAATLPTCLSLFLGTSEWRGYPVSHLSERTQPTSEKSSRVSISLNQLIGSQTPQLHSSTPWSQVEVAPPSLEVWQQAASSRKYPEKCQLYIIRLSLIRWSL